MRKELANCIGHFGFTQDKPSAALLAELRTICSTCPVQQQCLDLSIINREEAGIWGGLTYAERGKYAFERKS